MENENLACLQSLIFALISTNSVLNRFIHMCNKHNYTSSLDKVLLEYFYTCVFLFCEIWKINHVCVSLFVKNVVKGIT